MVRFLTDKPGEYTAAQALTVVRNIAEAALRKPEPVEEAHGESGGGLLRRSIQGRREPPAAKPVKRVKAGEVGFKNG
jgi:hypothetical protein